MLSLLRCCPRRIAVGALILGAAWSWMAPGPAAAETVRTTGQTVYVPVYSHIFIGDRAAAFNLAATLSIRNTDAVHSLTVTTADYYDSNGRLLKKHLAQPLVLKPLAATEVFIPESDTSGGFGASFMVRWKSERPVAPPVIECLMIGARSGQGISIVSPGRVIPESPP
jgi:hypothetical protein